MMPSGGETVFVMEYGVAHNPKTWKDLLGVYTSVREKYDRAWAEDELSRRKFLASFPAAEEAETHA